MRGAPKTVTADLPRRLYKIGLKYYFRWSNRRIREQVSLGYDRDYAIAIAIQGNKILDKRSPYRKDTSDLRKIVFARDGHRCVYCGTGERLTRGGRPIESNLVTACHSCNSSKGARNSSDFVEMAGWAPEESGT